MSWARESAADSHPADQTLWRTDSALPISVRAARRAWSRDMPCRILSVTEASKKLLSSSWISLLRRLRWKRARIPPVRLCSMRGSGLGFEDAVDGGDLAAPLLAFFFEGFSAGGGELVVARAAVVLSCAPCGGDVAGGLPAA